MIEHLEWKPDIQQTFRRFEAWWHSQVLDRPPVTLSVRPQRPVQLPVSGHATLRERWLDVEFAVERAIAGLSAREFVGDTLPIYWPNIGPDLLATVLGCELEFAERTSWSAPIVHAPEDWERIAAVRPNFNNVYWRTMERVTDLALQQAQGRFLVGITDLHGNYDLLSALRGPQELCMDLVDCPERVEPVGRLAAEVFVQAFERCWSRLAAAGGGSTTWIPFYHPGPAYVPSCDFWCMVSPETARDTILPLIRREMQPVQRSIFHLDGPQALRHLDLLLELPELNGVQWVYGAGAGPAARWIDVYKRIQAAGKCVQVQAEDAHDALTVLDATGPVGVLFSVGQRFDSAAQAQSFLEEVQRRSTKGACAIPA